MNIMDKIFMLEEELKVNKSNIFRTQNNKERVKEYREYLVQRANIKDMLLNAYRNQMLIQRRYG